MKGDPKNPFSIATTLRRNGGWALLVSQDCLTNPWSMLYNHHHHVVHLARISLTLSRHFSLSFIASGWSSGLHPVSSYTCCMYIRAGRPAFARPYVGVHRSISLMSSSLLLQQCSACLFRLTWIVFVMGGMWPYSWCLVGCCRQDLFHYVNLLYDSTWDSTPISQTIGEYSYHFANKILFSRTDLL